MFFKYLNVQIYLKQTASSSSCRFLFKFTFGFFDDMTHAKPVAHMVKGLVPSIAPLIYIVTGASPDHVVQCIITCSYDATDYRNERHFIMHSIVWFVMVTSMHNITIRWKLSTPKPATWAPLPRELPGASMRSARLLNWPSVRLKTRLEANTKKNKKQRQNWSFTHVECRYSHSVCLFSSCLKFWKE